MEKLIERLTARFNLLADELPEALRARVLKCFLNTVETTLKREKDGSAFVITGDIPAMWLRDSTAQVAHYLRFADEKEIAEIIRGVLLTQQKQILCDPYANAFNHEESHACFSHDLPTPNGFVWERKFEIDSLCYPVWLMKRYIDKTGDESVVSVSALKEILRVLRAEQKRKTSPYYFIRTNCPPSDTLINEGRGAEVKECGLVWSGFRPSDDACVYGYHIPDNLFARKAAMLLAGLFELKGEKGAAADARKLSDEISRGLSEHAKTTHGDYGDIYAYEVDGMGHAVLMDDANVPSLLSLPYLGVCEKSDPAYLRTRAFVLSEANPFYTEGAFAKGVGSPHTPKGYVWPIALSMQMITSTDVNEKARLLRTLLCTDAGTGFMHESFDPDAPEKYTRSWFAWANSLFSDAVLRLCEEGEIASVLAAME